MPEDKNQTFRPRVVTALVIAAALAASTVKVLQHSCEACQAASEYAPMPHASLVGALYYSVLALALWRFKFNKYTLLALYVAAGCHVALVMELVRLQLLCIPCVICAVCVCIAAICAMNRTEFVAATAVLAGLIGINISSDLTVKSQHQTQKINTKELIGFNRLPLKQKGPIAVFVYERKGCPICENFNDLYLPKLATAYGKKIAIHMTAAPDDISTPTLVVGGAAPKMWDYQPSWKELSTAIDTNLHSATVPAKSMASTGSAVTR